MPSQLPWDIVKPMIKSRSEALAIPAKFRIDSDLRKEMEMHLEKVGADGRRFDLNVCDQDAAMQLIDELGIHIPLFSLRDVSSKWSVVDTYTNKVQSKEKPPRTLLRHTRSYLCLCGTDHGAGKFRAAGKREIPWQNVRCPAWVRVVSTHRDAEDGEESELLSIDEVRGIFSHSDTCRNTVEATRTPRIPLHPDLRDFALDLLRKQTPLQQLKKQCRAFSQDRWADAVGDSNFRFRLGDNDSTSLYRTIRQEQGIPQRSAAEDNLDLWFRSHNPMPPIPQLPESCVHYQAHVQGINERFELILSTPEQQEMAWKYGHGRQMLMDGTFGICNARVLLFILMVIDNENHGIPVAFLLFTAKTEHKAVHASYDSALLNHLLEKWRVFMGANDAGDAFDIRVALTDNDTKEQYALGTQFPDAFLMLCAFHTWQSWRGGLTKHLQSVPKGEDRHAVRSRLGKLLQRLIRDIDDYPDAISAYNNEVLHFRALQKASDQISRKQAIGALKFLDYLKGYLKTRPYWLQWSAGGVAHVASIFGIAPAEVVRTTNHLESLNGRIKGRFFEAYHHSGRLPRLDVYVRVLVEDVVPLFFLEYRERAANKKYRTSLQIAAGPKPATRINSPASIPVSPIWPSSPLTPSRRSQPASQAPSPVLSERSDSSQNNYDFDSICNIALLLDDDDDDTVSVPDNSVVLDSELGYLLQLDDDRSRAWISAASDLSALDVASPSYSLNWLDDPSLEHACGSSDIIANLPSDVSVECIPPPCAQPAPSSDGEILAGLIEQPIEQYTSSPAPPQQQNFLASLYRDLLVQEDNMETTIRSLRRLGMSAEELDEHMSPAIKRRFLQAPEDDMDSDPPSALLLDVEMTPPAELDELDVGHELVGFEAQLKEKRKPSHGWR